LLTSDLNKERELLQLTSIGDEMAFSKLFDFYRNRIYGIALKLTHSTTVAEEIVEDVFLKIWIRRAQLKEIQNFKAYIFTIARNDTYKILKQIAKNYATVVLTEDNGYAAGENVEHYLLDKEYTSLLQKAVDKLPKQQKQVYQLIKEEQLKRHEVAEILHIQPETVKFHLAQAMKSIRAFCMLHLNISIGLIFFYSFIF
jgi:RNA polymerase sigma-70 factor (family 1)